MILMEVSIRSMRSEQVYVAKSGRQKLMIYYVTTTYIIIINLFNWQCSPWKICKARHCDCRLVSEEEVTIRKWYYIIL